MGKDFLDTGCSKRYPSLLKVTKVVPLLGSVHVDMIAFPTRSRIFQKLRTSYFKRRNANQTPMIRAGAR